MIRKLKRRKALLRRYIRTCKEKLANSPEGSIRISCRPGHVSYYYRNSVGDHNGEYLSWEENRNLITRLVEKDYYSKALKDCELELSLVDKLLELELKQPVARVFMKLHRERRKLVLPFEDTLQNRFKKWKSQEAKPLEYNDTSKFKMTLRGDLVRSTAEKEIADSLYKADIPYKYEYPFETADQKLFYPDFTIWKPGTGEIFIWEHFGMMDRPNYVQGFLDKMRSYHTSGLFPGNGLIVTFADVYQGLEKWIIDSIIDKILGKNS